MSIYSFYLTFSNNFLHLIVFFIFISPFLLSLFILSRWGFIQFINDVMFVSIFFAYDFERRRKYFLFTSRHASLINKTVEIVNCRIFLASKTQLEKCIILFIYFVFNLNCNRTRHHLWLFTHVR